MTLGFIGIFCNLMVVSTIREEDHLQEKMIEIVSLAFILIANLPIILFKNPLTSLDLSCDYVA